ncbi:MAG: FHA domain-containing protein, partial [Betaproteobacteria bacterium]
MVLALAGLVRVSERDQGSMAKLVVSSGGAIVHQCFLDQERLNVGRQADNQVVIDDPAVSEKHAAIIPIGNDHVLQDLQSVGGTF